MRYGLCRAGTDYHEKYTKNPATFADNSRIRGCFAFLLHNGVPIAGTLALHVKEILRFLQAGGVPHRGEGIRVRLMKG